jgi:hypothetical protein
MKAQRLVGTFAAVATISTLGAGSAAAAETAESPCGSGYSRVGVYAIPESGPRVGTLEVHWNAGEESNCVLTYGYGATYGKPTEKSAGLKTGDGPWHHDTGEYKYYAGPVTTLRGVDGSQCIDVKGYVGREITSLSNVHCG